MVKDYNGKTLSCITSTKISKEIPNVERYNELVNFLKNGQNEQVESLSKGMSKDYS